MFAPSALAPAPSFSGNLQDPLRASGAIGHCGRESATCAMRREGEMNGFTTVSNCVYGVGRFVQSPCLWLRLSRELARVNNSRHSLLHAFANRLKLRAG
jgi:hypothetical protein